MKEKEQKLLEQEKLMHPSDISQCALFKDAVRFWLETYKRGNVGSSKGAHMIEIFKSYIHILKKTR